VKIALRVQRKKSVGEREEVGDSTNFSWVLFNLFKTKIHLTQAEQPLLQKSSCNSKLSNGCV